MTGAAFRDLSDMPAKLFLAAAVAASVAAAGAAHADGGPFDGRWTVTLACPDSPDGARAFGWDFEGEIKGGMLHAERGQSGRPAWMSLDGLVQPNGDAALQARGVTGSAAYSIDQTARGTPYVHAVTAHFDGARGAGSWTTNRVCDFTFRKL
jgi:hypothetical protein